MVRTYAYCSVVLIDARLRAGPQLRDRAFCRCQNEKVLAANDLYHGSQTLEATSLTTIGHFNDIQASRVSSVSTQPREGSHDDVGCAEDGEARRTWVGRKRNDLITVPPDQFLREDDICLFSGGEVVGELAGDMTYELALSVQPNFSLPPPFRPILKGFELQSGAKKRRTVEMNERSGVDYSSLSSLWSVEERGKEKLCKVKMPYEEVQLWTSGGFFRTYRGHWFQRRDRSRLPWVHPRKGP